MISIIGSGRVGSTIAFLCGSSGLDNVLLVNRDGKKAYGIALDISNAIPQTSPISITGTSDYTEIAGSDVIIIAVSASMHVVSRTELLHEHASLIREISSKIKQHASDSKILVVTNPVDVLTYVIQKHEDLPPKNVLGIASSLDSSRFRYILARELKTNQSEISGALVMGEHDDSMVPIFSNARFGSKKVSDLLTRENMDRIKSDVRNYWKSLRDSHWYSVFGIAKNTFAVAEAIIKNHDLETSASVLLEGQYGVTNVCIGVPLIVNKDGIKQIRTVNLEKAEAEALYISSNRVKENIRKVFALNLK